MAITYTKELLSGSTDGAPILVAAIVTAGTLIHTAGAGVVNRDEIWLYAMNNHTVAVDLAIEWGGVVDPLNIFRQTIDFKKGLFLVVPGLVLQNAKIVRAFANVANVITISGFVNRITP